MIAPWLKAKGAIHAGELSCDDCRIECSERYGEPADRRTDPARDRPAVEANKYAVEIYPPDVVQRRAVAWGGIAAEVMQATRREKLEFRFRAPLHLLTVCDRGIRSDDTFVSLTTPRLSTPRSS